MVSVVVEQLCGRDDGIDERNNGKTKILCDSVIYAPLGIRDHD
jgi:hypothetical protein